MSEEHDVIEALSAFADLAPVALSPEARMSARRAGRQRQLRRRVIAVAVGAALVGGVGTALVLRPDAERSVLVPASPEPSLEPTASPTPSPTSSPTLSPEDAEAIALCRQHFPTTVTGHPDTVATARSQHGPGPAAPTAFPGLSDESPVALCLVRPESGNIDTVYAVSSITGEAVVVWRQGFGGDEIVQPI